MNERAIDKVPEGILLSFPSFPRLVLLVFGAIAFCYAFVLVFFWWNQESLLYFPDSRWEMDPKTLPYTPENVMIPGEDGVKLSLWFFPPTASEGQVVIFCHGNGGNLSYDVEMATRYQGLGLGAVLFDYRGYGKSTGKPSSEGTLKDALSIYDWLLRKGISKDRILVHGRSLGGPHAAHIAQNREVTGLILESTFTSLSALAQQLYPFLPIRLISRHDYQTLSKVESLDIPILVIHAPEDGLIPFSHGKTLFSALQTPSKSFLEIHGDHNEGFVQSAEIYWKGIEGYLSRD